MMIDLTLCRRGIEPSIVIPETHFFTLSIENKALLLSVLSDLRSQSEDGKDGSFNLLLGNKALNIERSVAFITDFTDIDFNSKPITSLLMRKFADFLGLGEQAQPLTQLESIVLNLVEDFHLQSGLKVEYNTNMGGNNIAKVCSLKIADDGGSLLERLCEYVNLLCDLKPLKLLVLAFAHAFLERGDIEKLYQHCFDKNVRLLIIEGMVKNDVLPNERRLIIDADLCTITNNIGEDDNEI